MKDRVLGKDFAGALLETKFHVPKPPAESLERPRLLAQLRAGLDRRLILLSAPAGYGKTTLLAQFAAEPPLPIAWYQLDDGDNDPAHFFACLVATLSGAVPEFGATSRSLLQSNPNMAAQWQRFLVVLTNELVGTVTEDVLLVLEDYHLVGNPVIHGFVDALLHQGPAQLHLLLSTRSDPLLSLARLRARRQMTEVRAHDLRFTANEVQSYLSPPGGAEDLSPFTLQQLLQKTEGWAAALQLLLASSGQRRQSALPDLLAAADGTNRYLFDYLSEEVLASQPAEVRDFLLATSILQRMSAPLCDALLETGHTWRLLEMLEARNLFTVSLDEHRRWYRYHHLFQTYLQERLQRERTADEIRALHRRAAACLEEMGEVEQALYHYREAQAWEKLAQLLEDVVPAQLAQGRLQRAQRWLEALPDGYLRERPWLALYRGILFAVWGQADEARRFLARAQRTFTARANEQGQSRVLAQLSRLAFFAGRYEESLELSHRALRKMPWADHEGRAQAFGEQAELWVHLGNSARAAHAAGEAVRHARHLDSRTSLAQAAIFQGVALRTAGRLDEALRSLNRGMALLESDEAPGVHIAHSQIGAVSLERWQLEEAASHFRQSLALSEKVHDPPWIVYAHYCLGIVHGEQEEPERAQTHFDAAIAVLRETGLGNLLAEGTWHYVAENHLQAGRYAEAEACSRRAIAARNHDSSGLAWGLGWLPLAKTYLAIGRGQEAEAIFRDVETGSGDGGNAVSLVDSALHLAWIHLQKGEEEEAADHARRALAQAAIEGHRWMFQAQRERALPVLRHALQRQIEPAFVRRLLREMGQQGALPDSPTVRPAPVIEAASVQPADGVLQVTTLGRFGVALDKQVIAEPEWLGTKAGNLFAYFLTARQGTIPRDRVLEALWPGSNPQKSVGAFHTALYEARQVLRRSGLDRKFISTRSGEYYMEKDLFWVDVDAFNGLLEACAQHQHVSLNRCDACAHRLQTALDLYHGDYLESLYDDWALEAQRPLAEAHLNALQQLAGYYESHGDRRRAAALQRQVLEKDPLHEEAHGALMQLYLQMGERSGALRQYRELEALLADELGVDPMPETQALYRSLLHPER